MRRNARHRCGAALQRARGCCFWPSRRLDRTDRGNDARLDHDGFGSIQSKTVVIDSNNVERDANGKPLHTFPHPALEYAPIDFEPAASRIC